MPEVEPTGQRGRFSHCKWPKLAGEIVSRRLSDTLSLYLSYNGISTTGSE